MLPYVYSGCIGEKRTGGYFVLPGICPLRRIRGEKSEGMIGEKRLMSKKRNIDISMLILGIGILIAAIVCTVYILNRGGHYRHHSHVFVMEGELEKCTLDCKNEGIVEMTGTSLTEDRELLVDIRALSPGKTEAVLEWYVRYPDGNVFHSSAPLSFRVNWFGVVIEDSIGINMTGYQVIIGAVLLVLLLMMIVMVADFWRGWKRGEFTYSLVARGGLGIFSGVLFLFTVYKMANNVVKNLSAFITIVSDIGNMLLLALFPAIFLIACFLVVTNVLLVKHEGANPVNWLGFLFAFFCIAGFFAALGGLLLGYDIFFWLPRRIRMAITYVMCYMQSMFIATVAVSVLAARYRPEPDMDYMIILGCGIRKDGSLPPLLKGRVDSALEFEREQFEKTGKHVMFVPSGGQGVDEVISESEAMSRYLRENGIPDGQILQEDKSTTTMENMAFSRQVILDHGGDPERDKIAFSTTNYHVFRGYILSRKCGFAAKGVAAQTKTWFYPNAFLREFAGLIYEKRVKHAAFILMIMLFFFSLDYLSFG